MRSISSCWFFWWIHLRPIPGHEERHRLDHDCDPGHATRRRGHIRFAGRSLRTSQAADGERGFLFRDRIALRVRSQYTVFLVLRTIYGIGMGGEWGVGASLAMESAPCEVARDLVRHRAKRIFHRLSAGSGRRAFRSAQSRMARHVLGGRRSGAAGVLHPLPGAGVGSLETASSADRWEQSFAPPAVIGGFFFTLSC